MRLALFLGAISCSLIFPVAAPAQVESPQAREIRAQLEALQARLADLTRHDSSGRNVTEIGSSRGRSHQEDEPRLVVRIYDLSDLFSIAPRYAAHEPGDLQARGRAIFPDVEQAAGTGGSGRFGGGGMGGAMGGGMFAVPATISPPATTLHQATGAMGGSVADSSRSGIDSLIDTITATISPQEWDSVGGPASIKSLGASLVVSAPIDLHDKIGALLDLFRKRWGSLRTVSLQAHWLWLSEEQLAAGLSDAAPPVEGKPAAFGAVSEAGWKKLRDAATVNAKLRRGYHAVLTCYNGQTVYALAGGQQLVVAGMTPVVGGGGDKGGASAYHPNVQTIQEGAALQITPIATRTAKFVVADVHSRVNLLAGPAEKLAAAAAKDAPVGEAAQVVTAIDRPVLQSQRLSTTLRLPADRPTLIGGMSFQLPGGDANLYLFVTAHVQELRDDEGGEVKPAEAAPAEPKPAEPKPSDPAAPKP